MNAKAIQLAAIIRLAGIAVFSMLSFTSFLASSAEARFRGWVDDGTVVRLRTVTDDVGIGTSSPAAKLHVEGSALFQNLVDSVGAYQFNDAAGNRLLHIDTLACDIPSDPSTCSSLLNIGAQRTLIQPFTGESDTALLVRTANGFDLLRVLTNVGDRRVQVGPGKDGEAVFRVVSSSPSAIRIDTATDPEVPILAVDAATQRVGIGTSSPTEHLHVVGNLLVTGTKSFAHAHPTDPTKEITYVALEGGEAGTYIRGTSKLINGKAVIELPKHFSLVTSENSLTVQLTPRGEWLQLYVGQLNTKQIVVHEGKGKSGQFDYLVQGVRQGYEHHQVTREKVVAGR